MVVELLNDKKRWDQFVENSPQGLLFHKWDFLKTVERHSEYQLLPYCVYLGEEPTCIFPFFIKKDRLRLTHMASPPPRAQIPYLGIAYDPSVQTTNERAREKIFADATDEVCREIDKINPNHLYFRTVPSFLDVRSFLWKNFTAHLMFTYAIDLEKPVDEIWASLTKTCRKKIKRVSARSPEIQQTNDISALLDMSRQRFTELEMKQPLLSDDYLKELVAAFPLDMTVYNVTIDGRLATAIAYCAMQKERYCSWIGGINARRELGVVEYLEWQVVRRAKSEGFKKLDLLGTPTQHISRFKSKFGPILEPFCYVEKTDTLAKMVNFAYAKLAGSRLRSRTSCPAGADTR